MLQVNQPLLDGREKELLIECIETGWISSDGPNVKKFEDGFADYLGVTHGVAVANGTVALEAALFALGVGEGDESKELSRCSQVGCYEPRQRHISYLPKDL